MKDDGFVPTVVDPVDARVAEYLAAGPAAGKKTECRIVTLLDEMSNDIDDMKRSRARCNVVLARINGRMIKFFDTASALEDCHAR